MAALLRGEAVDLGFVGLDLHGLSGLQPRACDVVRAIPRGRTPSHDQVAERLGGRHRARGAGQAMARNRFAPFGRCHAVLGAEGRPGGFSARGGLQTRRRRLQIEGAWPCEAPDLFAEGGRSLRRGRLNGHAGPATARPPPKNARKS
jgi:methylated-DNA-[protein]-cysteine S-methyltransferase